MTRTVHGDDLLYRFFQDLFLEDPHLAADISRRMLEAMAIWLPLDVYAQWPILLPWVVRDPSAEPTVGVRRQVGDAAVRSG